MSSSSSNPSIAMKGKESSSVVTNMLCLPDDVLLNCLARVSRLYYPTLSLVSKRFRSLLAGKELYETRTLLGLIESCLYVSLVFPRSSKSRWFTLCGRPTRFPNPSSRWFTLCFSPCILTNRTKKSSGNVLVSVPAHNFFSPRHCITATIGSNVYIMSGGLRNNGMPSSKVFVMDCRSHTWHEAPSLRVARKYPLVSVLDWKLYVVEGIKYYDFSTSIEFFDPETRRREHVPSPGAEIRGTYIRKSVAFDGNLYLYGDKTVVYKPKENKWEALGDSMPLAVSHESCVIDNVLYIYSGRFFRMIYWYNSKEKVWKALKGLEEWCKLPKGCARMVNYGGNIVVLWEDFVSSIGSIKTKIWCAEIALERLNGQGIYGKVNWCYVVLTVPKSCSIEDVLVTTF